MSKGKRQVNEQRQDGQILTTGVVKVNLWKNPQSVRHAEKQTLLSSMLIKTGVVATSIALHATKNSAKKDGIKDQFWIAKRRVLTNTELRQKISSVCTKLKKAAVQFVTMNQKPNVGYMLTTTMKPVKYEDCYVTVAMWHWGLLRKT